MVTIRGLFRTQISKMNLFFRKDLMDFDKKLHLDVWEGSEYACEKKHCNFKNIVILKLQTLPEKGKNLYFVYIEQNNPNNKKYVHNAA